MFIYFIKPEAVALSSLHALRRTFTHMIESKRFVSKEAKKGNAANPSKKRRTVSKSTSAEAEEEEEEKEESKASPIETYRLWLIQQFNVYIQKLVGFILVCISSHLHR